MKHVDSNGEIRVTHWVSAAVLLIFLFFFRSFAAPFFDPLGEPRRATSSSIYFTVLAFIYIWLASVTLLTVLPHISTKYNVIIATALFFYMSFMSISALLLGRFVVRSSYYMWLFVTNRGQSSHKISWAAAVATTTHQSTSEPDLTESAPIKRSNSAVVTKEALQKSKTFPELMAFHRPFRRVFRSSLMVSASLCLVYAHCWSRSLSAFKASRAVGATIACRGIFGSLIKSFPSFINADKSCDLQSCANESLIWLLWVGPILSHLFYFAMNEFSGKHLKSYKPPKKSRVHQMSPQFASSESLEREGIDDVYDDTNGDDTHDDEDMNIDWSLSSTIKKFARTKPERPKGTLAMVPWFHVMLIKSGFDLLVSLHIFLGRFDARKMQVALRKSNNSNDRDQDGVFDFTNECGVEQHHAESGFWFDFMSDCGDGFNSSYQVARCLAQPSLTVTTQSSTSKQKRTLPRGKVLVIGGDLAYPDPTPETYENRFFRTFEDALPPPNEFRREHISIHKPALPVRSWAIPLSSGKRVEEEKKCCENYIATDEPDETLQSYSGPCAFAIPGNHDWFDGLATYTRYILSRDWLGGWIMPQQQSYFALQLPRGWWVLGMDLALDNDINIEQFGFFANLAKKFSPNDNVIIVTHIPFWVLTNYEHYPNEPEKNLAELVRTHMDGKVRLRLAGDLHHYTRHMPTDTSNKPSSTDEPVLIVSGGGGAFLHPTHCFNEVIKVGTDNQEYVRVAAYPSARVSKHLSWMNLWHFRWTNWRLDIFWFVTYVGMCASFFPLCGVYDDYLKSNPTHSVSGVLHWSISRVFILLGNILITGRVSLIFALFVTFIVMGFTETGLSRTSTYYAWSLLHVFTHVLAAMICLLFVECMAEFIISEGLVSTQDDVSSAQSCGTGLASSIFDEYESHFSHALDDFKLLGSTNSTFLSSCRNLLQSSRLDEQFYGAVSETFSWVHNEAPLMKRVLEFFDLPGVIGSSHAKMCAHLCSGGRECLYSNDFASFQQLDRLLVIKYIAAISFYYGIFAIPIAGNVLGTWLALTLNVLKTQYNEGFSSLRLEHWKNFLRMHIDEHGDLEIFSIGLHRVPKKWVKDPLWDGDIYKGGALPTKPSFLWKSPSKWTPMKHFKKCNPEVIDYTKISCRREGKKG